MKEVKIYTIVSDQLSPPITGESFCTDMVRHSDYADLEEKCAALAAENAAMKSAKEIIRHLNANREEANFCGIDDCHIDDAVEAMLTPATAAFLAEVRAQGVEMFATQQESLLTKYPEGSYGQESAYDAAQSARGFAQQLREGKAE
ncbi:hypothetical protein FI178_19440 [Salmonella enterica subsp. enterica]|nr:hypothetical protein [Salmonella enterica subsp. enterica]